VKEVDQRWVADFSSPALKMDGGERLLML